MNYVCWQVAAPTFVAGFIERDGVVTVCAPILRRFVGQPVENVMLWVKKIKGSILCLGSGYE